MDGATWTMMWAYLPALLLWFAAIGLVAGHLAASVRERNAGRRWFALQPARGRRRLQR